MQLLRLKLFFLLFGVLLTPGIYAQTCTGSLGDPVINQDFGSGTGIGPPLPGSVTNYSYTNDDCPADGYYKIENSLIGCFHDTWHSLTTDHTGNTNGYMMVINASFNPGIFYKQTTPAGALCPNTTYEFAAYIINLITPQTCDGLSVKPNITFSIERTDGTIIKQYNTGDIPPSDNPNWKQYGTFFNTPADVTNVVVKMINNAVGGCGNDLALDDITFRACGPQITVGFESTTSRGEQELCEGGSADFSLQASVTAESNPKSQWQKKTGSGNWIDLPGENSLSLSVKFVNAAPGTYQYRVGIGNGSDLSSANCRIYSEPLTIMVNPLPVIPVIPPQTFCEGNTLTLTASGGASYLWTGPHMAPSSQNPLVIDNVSNGNAGTYAVIVTTAKGCVAAPLQVPVTIVPKVVPDVSADAAICQGESTQLSASGGLYYKWMPASGLDHDDIPNPVATPAQTTLYKVNISNNGCSDNSGSVTVRVRTLPVANAGTDKTIFEGQSVKLDGVVTGDELANVYWTPAIGLDDPRSATPVASPVHDITYTLHVESQNCGLSTSSVFVRVFEKIRVTNTFSPNGDGINDLWNIDKMITYPECSVLIYNRYGQKVYQSTGYAKPWDGKLNNEILPVGTYYYIIDLKNDTPKISGWVVIVK